MVKFVDLGNTCLPLVRTCHTQVLLVKNGENNMFVMVCGMVVETEKGKLNFRKVV